MVDKKKDEGNDEELKQKQRRKAIIVELIGPGIIIISISLIISYLYGWWMGPIAGFLGMLSLSFTWVGEGNSKLVEFLGKLWKPLMTWTGHDFDNEYNVVDSTISRWFGWLHIGGLCLVGLWPFWRTKKYSFRYTRLELTEEGLIIKHYRERLDSIRVRPTPFPWAMAKVETRQRVPLMCEWVIVIQIKNPVKALIKAPANWFEATMSLLEPLLRAWTGLHSYDDMILLRDKKPGSKTLFEQLQEYIAGDTSVIRLKEWGIEVLMVDLKKVGEPEELRRAATRQQEEEWNLKAVLIRTVEVVRGQWAIAFGITPDEVSKKLAEDKNKELLHKFLADVLDLYRRDQAIAGRSFVEIQVKGGDGTQVVDPLARLAFETIAALQRMPAGGQMSTQKAGQEGTKPGEEPPKESLSEYAKRKFGRDLPPK